jgi:hypothetical protein
MNPAAYDAVVATRLLAMPAVAAATAGRWRVQITIRRAVATASIGLSLILIATSARFFLWRQNGMSLRQFELTQQSSIH